MYGLQLHMLCLFVAIMKGMSQCLMTADKCEYWLEIELHMTMMNGSVAVYPANGMLYSVAVTNITAAQPIDIDNVISADGFEKTRLIVAVNKTMPGPPIEVYEGQTLIVHVKNLMHSNAVSIHWHGLHQKGTPWMDGVSFITQCPILPGQSFTYTFKASPKGTFWYHSHIGSQISMGLLGPLIIREKVTPLLKEFIMMIQDWNHDFDGDMIHLKMLYGNYVNRTKLSPTSSLDGAIFSMFPFQSGLINGRGRFYDSDGIHNQAPLTVFKVQESKSYRFRVIGATSLYPFRVSIDDHPIKLVDSDGFAFEPEIVESFIINSGERFDFEITANQSVKSYWIRAETLEVNVQNHIAEAILRYEGAPEVDPATMRKNCTRDDRCLVVNCPFTYYPEDKFTDCKDLGKLRAVDSVSVPGANKTNPETIQEIFMNFAFPGTDWTPASVNGRTFQFPTVSSLTQHEEVSTYCDPNTCGEDQVCKCTYSIDLEHNKVYQMVFLNMGLGKGWAHPIHLHGHSFYVVKMGYPIYSQTTGTFISDNLDIDCRGNANRSLSFCNSATWANKSWGGNNIPGLQLEFPIQKDTIIVPSGGYVVVRIRADNPGLWFIHCHIELHSSDGMAMMLNESFSDHPPPPAGFPRCSSFDSKTGQTDTNKHKHDPDVYTKQLFWIVVGCLIALVIILAITIYMLCRRVNEKKLLSHRDEINNPAFENANQ